MNEEQVSILAIIQGVLLAVLFWGWVVLVLI